MVLIQNLVNDFDGTVSVKNGIRKYFYVNEEWLRIMRLEKSQVIGKTDEEIVPEENASFIKKN
ncbi:MAG: hypothetical protein ACXVNM_02185 [Bacteroidia bacterium]